MKSGKSYTKEFKFKVAIEMIKGDLTADDIEIEKLKKEKLKIKDKI